MDSGIHEIRKPEELDFLRDRHAVLDNIARRREMILQAKAFRKLLPRREWDGKEPKWSDIYHVASIDGYTIIDTHGARRPLKHSLPVKEDAAA